MFLRTTPEVVLWPPHACAHENIQMWTHILTHFHLCIHIIHVFKKIVGPVVGKDGMPCAFNVHFPSSQEAKPVPHHGMDIWTP